MIKTILRDSLQNNNKSSFSNLLVGRSLNVSNAVPSSTRRQSVMQIIDGDRLLIRRRLILFAVGILGLDLLALTLVVFSNITKSQNTAFDLNVFVHSVAVLHVYLLFRLLDMMMSALEKIKYRESVLRNASITNTGVESASVNAGPSASPEKIGLHQHDSNAYVSHAKSSAAPFQVSSLPSFLYD